MNTQPTPLQQAVRGLRRLERQLDELKDQIMYLSEQSSQRELIKLPEAADTLGVHPRTIERMHERGEIHKFNADGSVKTNNGNTAVWWDRQELISAKNA